MKKQTSTSAKIATLVAQNEKNLFAIGKDLQLLAKELQTSQPEIAKKFSLAFKNKVTLQSFLWFLKPENYTEPEPENFDFEFSEPEKPKSKKATAKKVAAKVESLTPSETAAAIVEKAKKPKAEVITSTVIEAPKKAAAKVEPVVTTKPQKLKQFDAFGFPILKIGDVVRVWYGLTASKMQPVECTITSAKPEIRMYSAMPNGLPTSWRLHSKHVHSIVSYVDERFQVPKKIFASVGDPRYYARIEKEMDFSTPDEIETAPVVSRETTKQPQTVPNKPKKQAVKNAISFDDL